MFQKMRLLKKKKLRRAREFSFKDSFTNVYSKFYEPLFAESTQFFTQ
jgi:hypothetical protein